MRQSAGSLQKVAGFRRGRVDQLGARLVAFEGGAGKGLRDLAEARLLKIAPEQARAILDEPEDAMEHVYERRSASDRGSLSSPLPPAVSKLVARHD